MAGGMPAVTGKQLQKLLEDDDWLLRRHNARHGTSYSKQFNDGTRVTIIPNTSKPLPIGTLRAILGLRQTRLGRKGLLRLLDKGKRRKRPSEA